MNVKGKGLRQKDEFEIWQRIKSLQDVANVMYTAVTNIALRQEAILAFQ
jgi:hypothetical protein